VSEEDKRRRRVLRLFGDEVCGRTSWDEPPELHRLHMRDDRPSLQLVPVPLGLWAGARPPEVLAFVATAMWRFGLRAARGGDLYGMAFLWEGWGVDPEPGFDEQRVAQLSAEHALHSHPQRVEVRCLMAVDRYGVTYTVEHERTGVRPLRQLAVPPETDPVLTGAVVDALDSMVEQLFDIKLPERVVPERWQERLR